MTFTISRLLYIGYSAQIRREPVFVRAPRAGLHGAVEAVAEDVLVGPRVEEPARRGYASRRCVGK